jgi:hypothetical protein
MSIAFSQEHVISHITAYLGVEDLCRLDAVSRELSESMAHWEGKPRAWLTVAEDAGLSLANVDKASIKEVFRAVRHSKCMLSDEALLVHSKQGVDDLAKAAEQMRTMQSKHLQAGGRVAETFTAHLCFQAADVDAYLADPRTPVTSLPIFMTMGDKVNVKMMLTWRDGSMWLAAFALCDGRFQPFGMHLRSVSSPLILRKDFTVWPLDFQQQGSGLCCTVQKHADLAKSLKAGILCTGLLHDLEATSRCSTSANALMLDNPAWKVQVSQLSSRSA